ncbi:MAG: bifunctional GNAT family N-acetyltransferase/(deoxy)nucleoside triphosphate pyrophosphohydrolase [Kiloniellales bacterium]
MPITEAEGAAHAPGEVRFAPIESERLLLRPFEVGDATDVRRLAGDWEVARLLPNVPYPYGKDAAVDWINHTRRGLAAGSEVTLAVTWRDGGGLLGAVGLTLSLHGRSAELGYWIGRAYWGQGFATEAAAAILSYAFEGLGLKRVSATTLAHNKASVRVLEKLGMRFERKGSRDYRARGGVRPVAIYAITQGQHGAGAPPRGASEAGRPEVAPAPAAVPVVLVAAGALVDPDSRVLLAQRPPGRPMAGSWEFPGGKVKPGETPEAALVRELKEELGIDVSASCLAPFTFASHRYDDFHLLMPLYLCRVWEGTPTPREGQRVAWVRPRRLGDYPMPPADLGLVAMLRDLL